MPTASIEWQAVQAACHHVEKRKAGMNSYWVATDRTTGREAVVSWCSRTVAKAEAKLEAIRIAQGVKSDKTHPRWSQ